MDICKELAARNLPEFPGREQAEEILCREEYGILPERNWTWTVGNEKVLEDRFCSGKAETSSVEMILSNELGSHSFPVIRLLQKDGKRHPVVIFLNFHPLTESFYFPTEEIAESGVNVIGVNYHDLTRDNADFSDGVAPLFFEAERKEHDAGKIRMWAFCASRLLDYALTLPETDGVNNAVLGHSRLGKTALVAGMLDERFRFVFSNDSGCSGAALSRGNMGEKGIVGPYGRTGESIAAVCKQFPYWFAPCYSQWGKTNRPQGFDQHFLLASIAPRFVEVASASMDDWADPDSEFLCCAAASSAWEALGQPGFCPEGEPVDDCTFQNGSISYHRRPGKHFLSRTDWQRFLQVIERHKQV